MAKMSAIFYLGVNDLCVDEGLLGSRIEMQVDTGKLVILFPKLDEKNFAVPRTTLPVAGYSGSHEEGRTKSIQGQGPGRVRRIRARPEAEWFDMLGGGARRDSPRSSSRRTGIPSTPRVRRGHRRAQDALGSAENTRSFAARAARVVVNVRRPRRRCGQTSPADCRR